MPYVLLIIAIMAEVIASSLLKATDGFRKLAPSLGVVIGYGVAFYTLSLTLLTLPLGITYAMWSGLGTAATAIIGVIVYKEVISFKKALGLLCIIVGVVLLNSGELI